MKKFTYKDIEARRVKWSATPVDAVPFDRDDLTECFQRVIALGLVLELPVAEWVGQASKKELPISREARITLGKNIADERVHFDAFSFARAAYPVPDSIMDEAALISKYWDADASHPLEKAATAESGVFLCSLFPLSMFGGQSLQNIAADIVRDEQRHVAVNWGILSTMGYDRTHPDKNLSKLRQETLDFIFRDVCVPELGLDVDFFIEESQKLLTTGYSPELEALSDHSIYNPPFEVANNKLY